MVTHIARTERPTSAPTRSRISLAALLVKVIARISPGRAAPGRQQIGDAVGQHPGLARARAGEDQQRALAVEHRLALRLVEPGEQALGAVGAGFDRGGAARLGPSGGLGLALQRHRPSIARERGGEAATESGAGFGASSTPSAVPPSNSSSTSLFAAFLKASTKQPANFGVDFARAVFEFPFEAFDQLRPVELGELDDFVQLPLVAVLDQRHFQRLSVEAAALQGDLGCRLGAVRLRPRRRPSPLCSFSFSASSSHSLDCRRALSCVVCSMKCWVLSFSQSAGSVVVAEVSIASSTSSSVAPAAAAGGEREGGEDQDAGGGSRRRLRKRVLSSTHGRVGAGYFSHRPLSDRCARAARSSRRRRRASRHRRARPAAAPARRSAGRAT